ncbi:MAG TPA: His/Gly/Thr/Pro-type tRNA ligase C-terminal domain-containing protein, partial [Thermoanaerobaculia bacterium]|nr:His/Gly/Thr/Pro-type tRNA ligase C-terminal domain-containing protein [Thermoanaerobaculia bacterium]
LGRAEAAGAFAAALLGDEELAQGTVSVKDLGRRAQRSLPRAEAVRRLARHPFELEPRQAQDRESER